MLTDSPPPPHATHRSALLQGAAAEASATIALVQIRNALKALGRPMTDSYRAHVLRATESNLQILERCLATHVAAGLAPDPNQLALFSGQGPVQ